jgi:hypothetical protein
MEHLSWAHFRASPKRLDQSRQGSAFETQEQRGLEIGNPARRCHSCQTPPKQACILPWQNGLFTKASFHDVEGFSGNLCQRTGIRMNPYMALRK